MAPTTSSSHSAFTAMTTLARRIRRKEVSSVELVEDCLRRIERLNPMVNAVVTVDPERALAAARRADAALTESGPKGALHGIPVTVKDVLATAGLRTTYGSERLKDTVPAEDDPAVARLVGAGAVVVGKTNCPEFAMDLETSNRLFGATRNPWDLDRSPGGSSGGSAAAVSAGLSPLDVGTDLIGSLRLPAHYCGVFAHKPTFGIVPRYGFARKAPVGMRVPPDLLVTGPIARSAEDLITALQVLSGPDAPASVAWTLSLPPPRQSDLGAFRVAVWPEDPACPLEPEVSAALSDALDRLSGAGLALDEACPAGLSLEQVIDTSNKVLYGALSAVVTSRLPLKALAAPLFSLFEVPLEPFRTARSLLQLHAQWLEAQETRESHRLCWQEFFSKYDALICPVSPFPAPPSSSNALVPAVLRSVRHGSHVRSSTDQLAWNTIASEALLPATAVPIGLTDTGLPIGIQLVGPYLEDLTPLRLATLTQEALGELPSPPLAVE